MFVKVLRRHYALVVLCLALAVATGCSRQSPEYREAVRMTHGGDPHAGRDAIRKYGCQACHTIPGVQGATAVVGPPLDRMGSRVYIAGSFPNNPQNMMQWLRQPQQMRPHSAMPNMGVTEDDSRNIAAYLYTLR